MTTERTVDIAAAPAVVFDVVTDPSTHPSWRPTCEEFRSEDGLPLRSGSKLLETVRFLGRRYQTTYVVTDLEPDRLFAIQTIAGPVPLNLKAELAHVARGTRLTFIVDADAPRITKAILAFYLGTEARRLRRLVEKLDAGDSR